MFSLRHGCTQNRRLTGDAVRAKERETAVGEEDSHPDRADLISLRSIRPLRRENRDHTGKSDEHNGHLCGSCQEVRLFHRDPYAQASAQPKYALINPEGQCSGKLPSSAEVRFRPTHDIHLTVW